MYTGLAGVYAAALDETGDVPKYSKGFQVGAGMTITIVPQYAEGNVYGDNRRVKHKKKFKGANVTLGVTSLPIQAEEVMFGRVVSEEKRVVRNSGDQSRYIGLGLYANEELEDSDEKIYAAVWLYKVKLEDPGDDFETEGENVTYKTPSLSGVADALKSGDWCEKKRFNVEAEAIAWIKEKAGIVEPESGGGQTTG